MKKNYIIAIALMCLYSCQSHYELDKTNLTNIAIAIDSAFRNNDTVLLDRILDVTDLGDVGNVKIVENLDSIISVWRIKDSTTTVNHYTKYYCDSVLSVQKNSIGKREIDSISLNKIAIKYAINQFHKLFKYDKKSIFKNNVINSDIVERQKMQEIFDFYKEKPLLIEIDTIGSILNKFNVKPEGFMVLSLYYKKGNDFFGVHLPYIMSKRFVNKNRFVAADNSFQYFLIEKNNYQNYYYSLSNISNAVKREKDYEFQTNLFSLNEGFSNIIVNKGASYSWEGENTTRFKELFINYENQSADDITYLRFQIVIKDKFGKEIIKQTVNYYNTIIRGDIAAIAIPNINMYYTGFDVSNKNNFSYKVVILDFTPYPKDWTRWSRMEDYLKLEARKLEIQNKGNK
jgi:hypothetical protein